jgi:hypothetical protein
MYIFEFQNHEQLLSDQKTVNAKNSATNAAYAIIVMSTVEFDHKRGVAFQEPPLYFFVNTHTGW